MNRNLHRQQYFSTLNPNSIYEIPFKMISKQENRQSFGKNLKLNKQSQKSIQKKKYLHVVSQQKKIKKNSPMISSKNNKKYLHKKTSSVSLGGQKRNTNQSRISLNCQSKSQSSFCQSYQSITPKRINQQLITQHSPQQIIQPFNTQISRVYPIQFITQQNTPIQLRKVIFHKLNMENVNPHRSLISTIKFNTVNPTFQNCPSQSTLVKRPHKRQMSSGKIYSSLNKKLNQQQNKISEKNINLNRQNIFMTPTFDKKQYCNSQNRQRNTQHRRRNAGFIRSASTKKYKNQQIEQNHETGLNLPIQSKFYSNSNSNSNLNSLRKSNSSSTLNNKKYDQIDQCISKMSTIKKQIGELQSILSKRLQNAQIYSKSPICIKNSNLQRNIQTQKQKSHTLSIKSQRLSSSQSLQSINCHNTLCDQLRNSIYQLKNYHVNHNNIITNKVYQNANTLPVQFYTAQNYQNYPVSSLSSSIYVCPNNLNYQTTSYPSKSILQISNHNNNHNIGSSNQHQKYVVPSTNNQYHSNNNTKVNTMSNISHLNLMSQPHNHHHPSLSSLCINQQSLNPSIQLKQNLTHPKLSLYDSANKLSKTITNISLLNSNKTIPNMNMNNMNNMNNINTSSSSKLQIQNKLIQTKLRC